MWATPRRLQYARILVTLVKVRIRCKGDWVPDRVVIHEALPSLNYSFSGFSTDNNLLSVLSCVADTRQYLGAVILVLAAHTKQFKDSNFNVLKAAFNAVKTMLNAGVDSDAVKASCTAVAVVLSPAVDKLGDRKLQVK